jgi:hypothetical protein
LTGLPIPNRMFYCHLSIPDPLPLFKDRPWVGPSLQEAQIILDHLSNICNVHALSFVLSQDLVVEFADDGRRYAHGSLSHNLGGWFTLYHHDVGDEAYWKDAITMPKKQIRGTDQVSSSRKGKGTYSGVRFAENEDPVVGKERSGDRHLSGTLFFTIRLG